MSVVQPQNITHLLQQGALPEKVMPFSEPVQVSVLNALNNDPDMPDNTTDTEILLVVNGVLMQRYKKEINAPAGYRRWTMTTSPGKKTYNCPVSIYDTLNWRGLVEAHVKTIKQIGSLENIQESPYTVIPLFIAHKGHSTVSPPFDIPHAASIIISGQMYYTAEAIGATINAQFTNTSGGVIIQYREDGAWINLVSLSGAPSRSESWQSAHGLFGINNVLQFRMIDAADENIASNIISLPAGE